MFIIHAGRYGFFYYLYEACIKKAKSQYSSERIEFYCDDFLEHSFDCKFNAIVFVASIHHMDVRKALEKAKSLLNENGLILIVGLGKPSSFLDFIIEGMRVINAFMPNCQMKNFQITK